MNKSGKQIKHFGYYVFDDKKIKKYLSQKDYKLYISCKQAFSPLPDKVVESISEAVKKWALKLGASHFTHWFQPLNNSTGGKEVAFIDNNPIGTPIIEFSKSHLLKGEIDASNFPNGNTRHTNKARGYAFWDYTGKIFILNKKGYKVLHIPSVFVSYDGHSIDEKTPLLRAAKKLNDVSLKLLGKLGYDKIKKVTAFSGSEQEYFIIPKELYLQRKDLVLTGRTLLGAAPTKSQAYHGHYFSLIKNNIGLFMKQVTDSLCQLGINAKLQHAEVAPLQYEIVARYSDTNTSSDNNHIIMQILQQTASDFGLVVLLNEKPFSHVNGSGKHLNWSVGSNEGLNFFEYSDDNKELFLSYFISLIAGINKHRDLLQLSASSYSNNIRLGGNEAPPNIMSVCIGEQFYEAILQLLDDANLVFNNSQNNCPNSAFCNTNKLDISVPTIKPMVVDYCDRNRTSPFAFTGNKFEFRMLGSSQSISFSNTVLTTILTKELTLLYEAIKNSEDISSDLHSYLKQLLSENKQIIFNGDGYSEKWKEEAAKRGLVAKKDSLYCIATLSDDKTINLFSELKIMTPTEIKIRSDVYYEAYYQAVLNEAKTLNNMLLKKILPSLNSWIEKLQKIDTETQKHFDACTSHVSELTYKAYDSYAQLQCHVDILNNYIQEINALNLNFEKAFLAYEKILPELKDIRKIYDSIEPLIPQKLKPMPDYDDILYLS